MVNQPVKAPIALTGTDEAILAHVRRFRMTTQEVVHRLFYPGRDPDVVKSSLRRLRDGGHLASATLYQQRRYYHLTPRAARVLFGEKDKVARPFGEQALPRAYGILAFCCLREPTRTKYTTAEFEKTFPQLVAPGLPSSWYYRDEDGTHNRLGFIQVDHGAHHRRIVSKCHAVIRRRMEFDTWRTLITADRFVIAIVTARQRKADRIQETLREELQTVKFRIELVPELVNLAD
jgi:hypothetical protein